MGIALAYKASEAVSEFKRHQLSIVAGAGFEPVTSDYESNQLLNRDIHAAGSVHMLVTAALRTHVSY
jgi:hypothetical protein